MCLIYGGSLCVSWGLARAVDPASERQLVTAAIWRAWLNLKVNQAGTGPLESALAGCERWWSVVRTWFEGQGRLALGNTGSP